MPTYQYKCNECGTVTEVFHSITSSARRRLKKADNPQCDCDATVTRLIGTGAGIIFKGSGFYHTDYRSENYKKSAKAEKDKIEGKSKADGNGKAAKGSDSAKGKSAPKEKASKKTADD